MTASALDSSLPISPHVTLDGIQCDDSMEMMDDVPKWNHDVVWDGVTNLCTDPAGEKEGRKSFPSGHASFAWASMLILALYLLGRSRLNCENRSESTLRGGKKSLMLGLPLEEIHERRMNAKKTKRENCNQPPLWQSNVDARPQVVKHMSSEYIVDLSYRGSDL
ncbi:unnamed protein product [Peronospora destructor]|uniref:Phosphatidic acid phosphatase type 2/haloperoxidase domain-containing protein n=1 Tax=Peronospora destructor TaxID=86335 RepID=A0AAV0UGH6_9STRA|nr:unnamed protein product [Peronospora destructor]